MAGLLKFNKEVINRITFGSFNISSVYQGDELIWSNNYELAPYDTPGSIVLVNKVN